MIKKSNVYKFFLLVLIVSGCSYAFGMEEPIEKEIEVPKVPRKMESLQNLALNILCEQGVKYLDTDEKEYSKWLNSLPDHAHALVVSKYGTINPLSWAENILKKNSEGNTEFKDELELFSEFGRARKFVSIQYLLKQLENNWQNFSEEQSIVKLLNIIFKNTTNIYFIAYFRRFIIDVWVINCNKVNDLIMANSEDELQISQRKELNKVFISMGKICEEHLVAIDKSLTEGLNLGELVIDPVVEEIAEELISCFELNDFENFKTKFQMLNVKEQENVLNYIFAIHIFCRKSFSDIGDMLTYIDAIIDWFKVMEKDTSSALVLLLNYYAKAYDYIYDLSSVMITRILSNGVIVRLPVFIPKFYLIYSLKGSFLEDEYNICFQLFGSNETVALAKRIVNIYHKFLDYRLLNDFIETFFVKSFILISVEQADQGLISRFVKFLCYLKNEEILEEEFFHNLKSGLLGYIEAASISNKEEIIKLLNDGLCV